MYSMLIKFIHNKSVINVKMERIQHNVYKAPTWLGLAPSILEARATLLVLCFQPVYGTLAEMYELYEHTVFMNFNTKEILLHTLT